jgi:hypothetical protein
MLAAMGLLDRTVQVGVSMQLGEKDQHGSATIPGMREKVPFCVDRPKRLKRPAEETLTGIFKQLTNLGFPALSIELRVGRNRRVYQLINEHPVLVHVIPA